MTPFSPAAHVALIERAIVSALALERVPIAPDLAHAVAADGERPFVLDARVHRSDRVAFARFVSLVGPKVDVGGALVVAHPELALPILGADFVRVGSAPTLFAIDASPALAGEASLGELAVLGERRAAHPTFPSAGALPDFCAPWFSPWALFVRVDDARADEAARATYDFVDVFVTLARHPPARDERVAADASARQAAYVDAHREGDPSRRMLERLFGGAWTERFVRDVLFPSPQRKS